MKKSLIALAALATTGAAFSQSTATLYGQVDAALTTAKGNGITRTGLWNAGLGSSLLGFTGSEDLGGGLKGNFKIEGGLNMDSGIGASSNTNNQPTGGFTTQSGTSAAPNINSAPATRASAGGSQGLVFQRYAYLGLSGGFGEVRLGRDYAASFWNFTRFDPFGTNGVAASSSLTLYLGGANSIATTTNISNAIGYISPNISGFQLQAQAGYGENPSNGTTGTLNADKAGNLTSLNASYAAGPISLAVGTGTTKGTFKAADTTNGYAALPGDYTQSSIAGSYNFGFARVMAYRGTEKLQMATALKNTSTLLGVVVPRGALNLKASYVTAEVTNAGAKVDKGTLLGLGADYSFSKRTAAYVAYTKVKNDTATSYGIGSGAGRIVGTAAAGSATGMAAGLRHSF